MLAAGSNATAMVGTLSGGVQKPGTFRRELIAFIAGQLPLWRNRAERKPEVSETLLNTQLCAHLNSATRHESGWDILQFRVEEADEVCRGRKTDLVAAPAGTAIIIEGRRHIDFDSLMPIECKRLPTPIGNDRDEMEYVFTRRGTTGGIQRFKHGLHGAAHTIAAMIGYIQDKDGAFWNVRVAEWIGSLIGVVPAWSKNDLLLLLGRDAAQGMTTLTSTHNRPSSLQAIELQHLWIEMS
jgi:hypothetical protein